MKLNKKQIYILIAVCVVPLLLLGIYYFINQNKDVITTERKPGSQLPQVDVSSNDGEALNEYLKELYDQYTSDGKSKFNYTFYKYEDIISVLVDIDEYDKKTDTYMKKYIGFNIDKKTGNFIDKENITDMFGYDIVEIVDKVNQRLKEYYEGEASEGYIEKRECDYDCYLSYKRNINNILDSISLVIQNDKLVVYINLSVDAFSDDYEYFDNLDYDPYKIIIE